MLSDFKIYISNETQKYGNKFHENIHDMQTICVYKLSLFSSDFIDSYMHFKQKAISYTGA